MKALLKILPVCAAISLAFVGTAKAQLVTYETQSAYAGSSYTFGSNGTLGETFSNVSAVASLTYNFFASTSGSTSATNIHAVFGQWSGGALVGGTTVDFGTIVVPASSSGWSTLTNDNGTFNTYAYTFDLTSLASTYAGLINQDYGYLTSASNTYALMLTNTSGVNTNLALGLTNGDPFAYGATNLGFLDYAFAQIVVAPGNQTLVPVPETGTVASIIGGVFILGLFGLRMRQRRRQSPSLPMAAAA